MKETPAVRSLRRNLSRQLTKRINNVDDYPTIRLEVIKALAKLNTELKTLLSKRREKDTLMKSQPLLRFYMKGGNAFQCVKPTLDDGVNQGATQNGGGATDWDTQIIVDPWAPIHLQALLYGEIEETIMEVLQEAGMHIAKRISELENPPINEMHLNEQDKNDNNIGNRKYKLTCVRQTIRYVYDYERIGIWRNDVRKLRNDLDREDKWMPGILINDAIPAFRLYRLGYTWIAEPEHEDPEASLPPKIARPVLMELIDVTLPPRDTVEAVFVWQEFMPPASLNAADITVRMKRGRDEENQPSNINVLLPLPGLSYHLREIAIMLCEVADGSSRSEDKLPSRFKRFDEIYQGMAKDRFNKIVSSVAGKELLNPDEVHQDFVTKKIRDNKCEHLLVDEGPSFKIARSMMDIVAKRKSDAETLARNPSLLHIRFLIAREASRLLIEESSIIARRKSGNIHVDAEAAYSDDQVLIDLLRENGYFDADRIKLSGIRQGVVWRVGKSANVGFYAELLQNQRLAIIQHVAQQLKSEDTFRRIKTKMAKMAKTEKSRIDLSPGDLKEVMKAEATRICDKLVETYSCTEPQQMKVHSQAHSTVRSAGITYENTLLISLKGEVVACITLTSATPSEAPFRLDPRHKHTTYCSLLELANQRKVLAALTEDYSIKTALENQYSVLKKLL